jgi:hypothetical protein
VQQRRRSSSSDWKRHTEAITGIDKEGYTTRRGAQMGVL